MAQDRSEANKVAETVATIARPTIIVLATIAARVHANLAVHRKQRELIRQARVKLATYHVVIRVAEVIRGQTRQAAHGQTTAPVLKVNPAKVAPAGGMAAVTTVVETSAAAREVDVVMTVHRPTAPASRAKTPPQFR